MYGKNDAAYEQAVARAHSAVWRASVSAELAGRESDQLDLEQICRELTRIGEDALRRPRRRRPGAGPTGE